MSPEKTEMTGKHPESAHPHWSLGSAKQTLLRFHVPSARRAFTQTGWKVTRLGERVEKLRARALPVGV